jgi:hypothetical protein
MRLRSNMNVAADKKVLSRRSFMKGFTTAATAIAISTATPLPLKALVPNYVTFAGVGNGSTDDSLALQSAINLAGAQVNGAGTVWVPPTPDASYIIDNISLINQVSIVGGDPRTTLFQAKVGSTNNVFVIPAGHVVNCRYQNFSVLGNGNRRQHCFMLQAVVSGVDGGMWWALFDNLILSNFDGYSMWFRGGPNGFSAAHQFITINRCIFFRNNSTFSRNILMTGQVGQVTITGECQIDVSGTTIARTCNIELGAEFNNAGVVGGSLVGGSPVGTNCPYNIKMIGGTVQSGDMGIYVYNSSNVVFHAVYFENIFRAITATAATYNCIADSCHFTNAGSNGTNGGYIMQVGGSSRGSLINSDFGGNYDQIMSNSPGHWGAYLSNNIKISNPLLRETTNYNIALNMAPTMALLGLREISLNTNATCNAFTTLLPTGDTIRMTCVQAGSAVFNAAGGNLAIGHWATLTLQAGDSAEWEWSDPLNKVMLRNTTGVLT